jgi:predicted  nucleic acid-binding Zn-ribbon protein
MDNKERFDQIERLLAELLRKADRQDEFNAYQREFNSEAKQRLDSIDGRLDDITGILKIFAEAQKQSEARHEQVMKEIREQGRRTDTTQTEILRMMQKWDEQDAQNQAVAERLAHTDDHEPRIARLEDEVLRKAS